jgi:PAS domain S-box-containing protein
MTHFALREDRRRSVAAGGDIGGRTDPPSTTSIVSESITLQRDLSARVARFFYLAAALVLIVAALLLWGVAQPGFARLFNAGLVVTLALTVVLGTSAWWVRRGRLREGVGLSLVALAVAALGLAAGSGRGLHAVVLGLLGLVVLVAAVLLGRRVSTWMAVGAAAALVAMFVAQKHGLLGATAVLPTLPALNLLLTHLLLLALGLLFGSMLAEIVNSAVSQAQTRQQRFRTLLGIAADWYWELDADLRFTRVDAWNLPAGALHEAEVLGKTRWELPHQDMTAAQWAEHIATLKARRPFRDFVLKVITPDGGRSYLSISGEPVFDGAGRFSGYWGVGRGVTAEVEAQQALRASERRYRDLFERAPSPLLIHRRGVAIMANRAAAAQFGYDDPQALVGADVPGLHPPEERERIRARIDALEQMPLGGEIAPAELRMYGAGGEIRLVMASGVRVQMLDGPATLSIYFDITERKRAEAALRRSEEMLSRLFEASPDAMIVSEVDSGRIVLANEHYYTMLGLSREESCGRSAIELGVWDDPKQRQLLVESLRRGKAVRNLPVILRSRDGRALPSMVSAARLELDGQRLMVSIVRDVTARERARLQQEAVLKNASVGIAFTQNQVFLLVNPRFEEMFGWAPGTLQGQPGRAVWRSDEDYAEVGRIVGPLLSRGEPVDLERPMCRRDGSEFWCRVRARVVDPTHPASGGTIWIAEDITERHAFERALADAKEGAEAASRAKSAFLANMSHEIRTPLNGVLGLARLAQRAEDDAGRRRDYLQRLIESAEALAALISDTLDLSKIEAGKLTIERVPFDLPELVESACAAYREVAAAKGLALSVHLADVPRHVLGDPMRLRQIVVNFVSNAVKFTEQGRIDVDVCGKREGYVRVVVSDTGIGIDAATRERMFEPFSQGDESTTRRFGGTGLGLSICRNLAELMGGEIGFDSTPGAGSAFWVDLPLPAAPQPAPPPEAARDEQPLRGLRVLLVEDNAVNMLIAEQMLLHWGAEVTQAGDGRQAIAAVERAEGGFDAVLMDVHMPEMGGHEATALLRQRYSKVELPIIALTAAALVSEREQSLAVGMNDFIAKPIEAERMVEVLLRATAVRRAPVTRGA